MVKIKYTDLDKTQKYINKSYGVKYLYNIILHKNIDKAEKLKLKLKAYGTFISQEEINKIIDLKNKVFGKNLPKSIKKINESSGLFHCFF